MFDVETCKQIAEIVRAVLRDELAGIRPDLDDATAHPLTMWQLSGEDAMPQITSPDKEIPPCES